MNILTKDPLLTALRFIVYFIIGVLAFAATMVLIGAPFVLIFQADMLAELAADGVTGHGWPFIWTLFGMLIGIAGLLAIAIYFFYLLLKITDTVRDGDPFTPENATRLSRMGWTAIAGHVWGIILALPVVYVASVAQDAGEKVEMNGGFGGSGLVLILTLFILARVFRHGAAMRDDLEGTV